jgi:methionine synthase II (cobalamin-independent)
MKRSMERILTTHVGSLPRPPDLLEMIQAKERGGPLDAEAYANRVATAVKEVVHSQADSGIDIVADGEMGRFGFIPYVNERLAGSSRARTRAARALGRARASTWRFPNTTAGPRRCRGRRGGRSQRDGCAPVR